MTSAVQQERTDSQKVRWERKIMFVMKKCDGQKKNFTKIEINDEGRCAEASGFERWKQGTMQA